MPEHGPYTPGTPSWVDLSSPDLDGSAAFYGGLFGWACHEAGPLEETGGYRMFTQNDKYVAGMGPHMMPGMPTVWTTYIATEDADATAAKIEAAGGKVYMAPMTVMTAGRMGMFADPSGAGFAIWQPIDHPGAQLVNEHGALTWNELGTRDTDGAQAFYNAVFGWDYNSHPMGEGVNYTEAQVGGQSVGGMYDMTNMLPAEVPAHWLTYFWVDDCDASAAKATELGAQVMMGPTDIPPGRFALITDPQGAMFAIITPKPAE
ncbi:MAG: VOC family protein [Thermoleophilaceae bacterium]|nr:VOC family protein [Thermoleophilaceae bacterium]